MSCPPALLPYLKFSVKGAPLILTHPVSLLALSLRGRLGRLPPGQNLHHQEPLHVRTLVIPPPTYSAPSFQYLSSRPSFAFPLLLSLPTTLGSVLSHQYRFPSRPQKSVHISTSHFRISTFPEC